MLAELLFRGSSAPAGMPAAFAHVVDAEPDDPFDLAGFALWGVRPSTWTGTLSLYLEDLFVRPECRGRGDGAALLQVLADLCVERGYRRLEWSVLDWNEPAHAFYRTFGAAPLPEWVLWRRTFEPS
jgi:GNAT superfamily N-acetyltransferase